MNKSFPICFETFGNPKNPCIILVAGLSGQLIDWPSTLTEGLANKGFYVVTFDNRDSGLSHHYDELGTVDFNEVIATKQQGEPFKPPYSLEDMASDVIVLMDELHIEKAYIGGGSMGGIIAQYVAINYPNRVSSLILIATTSGDPQLPPAKKEVLEFFSKSLNPGKQNQSLETSINEKLRLFKIYIHPDYFDEQKIRNQIMASYKRAYYPEGFKRTLLAMICAEPRTMELKKLNVPCLIIHGDYDPVFSIEHGKHLAASIKRSQLEIIEKMGHALPDFICQKIVDLIAKYFNRSGLFL
jgi:pimeloyl-ACP methyl ester carboxylesterase